MSEQAKKAAMEILRDLLVAENDENVGTIASIIDSHFAQDAETMADSVCRRLAVYDNHYNRYVIVAGDEYPGDMTGIVKALAAAIRSCPTYRNSESPIYERRIAELEAEVERLTLDPAVMERFCEQFRGGYSNDDDAKLCAFQHGMRTAIGVATEHFQGYATTPEVKDEDAV